MTSMKVGELNPGVSIIIFGSCLGSIFSKRIQVPLSPGWNPSEVLDLDETSEAIPSRCHPFSTAISAIDIHPQHPHRVLATSTGGGVLVASVEDLGNPIIPRGDSAFGSFVTSKWADPTSNLFLASTLHGGVELWDVRLPARAVLRSNYCVNDHISHHNNSTFRTRTYGSTRQAGVVRSLAVHPVRSDLFASGDDDGRVALWDLRSAGQPFALSSEMSHSHCSISNRSGVINDSMNGTTQNNNVNDDHGNSILSNIATTSSATHVSLDSSSAYAGPIWKVAFDTIERPEYGSSPSDGYSGSDALGILFCTEGGALGLAALSSKNGSECLEKKTLISDVASINSFDVYDKSCGREIVAVSERQNVIYAHRT
eukprot:CAMPEP_0175045104 /NCGR_PEP_ID=MMETSP0052_2-20121109/4209_1 /TAXON_ID=51329 ORGANISM="Polytomella parva, Strain SAG 63-3" /NCGR_SAMPLE_ID=MMETSP0052_2 /ASSEMBLY_ACC=CAM_ASM_000194 /LENGTH=369 /DNA_ID=CAMNT_0016308541 /DNA_START=342 /DNA_END=1451 /DNA_ORIENTATION=-